MPELPEVETFRRYFERTSLNKRISSVSSIDGLLLKDKQDPKSLAKELENRLLAGSGRHGKYLFLITSDSKYLIIHFGMTGYLAYLKDGQDIPRYTRLLLGFGDSSLAFVNTRRLGKIFLYSDRKSFLKKRNLGPDALKIQKCDLRDRISKRKKPIKSALMDQSIIAGIGNLYADEILFQLSVHPRSLCVELKENIYEKMSDKIKYILTTAIERHAEIRQYPGTWLLPHRKKGYPCPRCGGKINIIKIAGRTTYFCPQCQKYQKRLVY